MSDWSSDVCSSDLAHSRSEAADRGDGGTLHRHGSGLCEGAAGAALRPFSPLSKRPYAETDRRKVHVQLPMNFPKRSLPSASTIAVSAVAHSSPRTAQVWHFSTISRALSSCSLKYSASLDELRGGKESCITGKDGGGQ